MVIITTIEMKYNAHGRHIINNLKTNMELLNHNFITTGGANSALFFKLTPRTKTKEIVQ